MNTIRLTDALADGLVDPGVFKVSAERIRADRHRVSSALRGLEAASPRTTLTLEGCRTVLDVHRRLGHSQQRESAALVFDEIVIAAEGVVCHTVRGAGRPSNVA